MTNPYAKADSFAWGNPPEEPEGYDPSLIHEPLKHELQHGLRVLFNKHEIRSVVPDIYEITGDPSTPRVVFNDEDMALFIAGHVTASTYDEYEDLVTSLGYEIIDTDGNVLELQKLNTKEK